MSAATSRRIINFISLIGMAFSVALTVYFFSIGLFDDLNALQNIVGGKIILGPIIFILIQILQVVVPVIPGGVSTAAGVLLFGPVAGFFYNYIGIVIGSMIVFLLGRRYGKPFVLSLINEKTYDKYITWFDNQGRFNKLFAIAIFFPFAPDDALCLIAGLTHMSLKTFSWIILLGKPASIFVYSMVLVYGTNLISQFI